MKARERFVDMAEVDKAVDILCAARYGEDQRERIRMILFLGIKALEQQQSAPERRDHG
jgi:hypothetical protein